MEVRIKNFLSVEDCKKLLEFYKNNLGKKFVYNMTEPMKILDSENVLIKTYLQMINKQCNSMADVYMDNAEIIRWLNNGYMPPHHDIGDKFAAIVYLNNDYQGGELVLENTKIKPEVGELIVFENGTVLHSVNVITGERFTLSTWFKLKESKKAQ
jgi:uncharacterized glyoxalase superfamily protein PhnB